jgi:hypothetical protein
MHRIYHLKQREALALFRSQDFPDHNNIADLSETSESEGEMDLRIAVALEERQKMSIKNRRRAPTVAGVARRPDRMAERSAHVPAESSPEPPELPGMVPSQPPVTRPRARPIRLITKPPVSAAQSGDASSVDSDLEAARRELQRSNTISIPSSTHSEFDLSRVTVDGAPVSAVQSISDAPLLPATAAIESSSSPTSVDDVVLRTNLYSSQNVRGSLDLALIVQDIEDSDISSAAAQPATNDELVATMTMQLDSLRSEVAALRKAAVDSDQRTRDISSAAAQPPPNDELVATMTMQLDSLRSEVAALRKAADDSDRRTREANVTVAFLMRKLETLAQNRVNLSQSQAQSPHSSQLVGVAEVGGSSSGQAARSDSQQPVSPSILRQRQGSVPLDDKTKRLLMQVQMALNRWLMCNTIMQRYDRLGEMHRKHQAEIESLRASGASAEEIIAKVCFRATASAKHSLALDDDDDAHADCA